MAFVLPTATDYDAEVVRPRWGWAGAGTTLGEELYGIRGIREPDAPGVQRAINAASSGYHMPPPPPPPQQWSASSAAPAAPVAPSGQIKAEP